MRGEREGDIFKVNLAKGKYPKIYIFFYDNYFLKRIHNRHKGVVYRIRKEESGELE